MGPVMTHGAADGVGDRSCAVIHANFTMPGSMVEGPRPGCGKVVRTEGALPST